MASTETQDESLYPIAVLIDELRNEDVQVLYTSLAKYQFDQIENKITRIFWVEGPFFAKLWWGLKRGWKVDSLHQVLYTVLKKKYGIRTLWYG